MASATWLGTGDDLPLSNVELLAMEVEHFGVRISTKCSSSGGVEEREGLFDEDTDGLERAEVDGRG